MLAPQDEPPEASGLSVSNSGPLALIPCSDATPAPSASALIDDGSDSHVGARARARAITMTKGDRGGSIASQGGSMS
eukprot:2556473-Rhodomonas_salina.1